VFDAQRRFDVLAQVVWLEMTIPDTGHSTEHVWFEVSGS
jgi:hypothetical protein